MIDFHTHILPHMDDGSRNIQESIALLQAESRQGITDVLLTSHYYADENSPSEFLARRARAWEKLSPHLTADLPNVHLGAEVQYFEGICGVKDISALRIEGTNCLLLEMPFCRWTDRMIHDVLELNEREDLQIVLAHIERYMTMQPFHVWRELHDRGVWLQSNVSVFGNWWTKLRTLFLIRDGLIDFFGSDCHNMRNRKPNWELLPPEVWGQIKKGRSYRQFLKQLRG